MTSALHLVRYGLLAFLIGFGGIGIKNAVAQTNDETKADQEPGTIELIDRSKLRLKLMMSLVNNELRAASLQKDQLVFERGNLARERAELSALGDRRRPADNTRLEQIEQRLEKINKEISTLEGKLNDIVAEQDDLQRRLDEANGVARDDDDEQSETETADRENGTDDEALSSASIWLDGKRRVQEALVYLGDYNALIDGDFGPRTSQAIRVYQERQSLKQTGVLTKEQEASLLEGAKVQRALYGVESVSDTELGYRLSYPTLLLSKSEKISADERRITTDDGLGELIISVIDDAEEIDVLYERAIEAYDVQYRRKRDGWFVVAGLVDEGRIIYDMVRRSQEGLVRARLSYPADKRDLWSPFAVIMFNTFEPLPTSS